MKRAFLLGLVLLATGASCERLGPLVVPAAEVGRELFHSPSLSNSQFNAFSCATCHATEAGDTRPLPGYNLHGVTRRPRWFGGMERDLLSAVNFCLVYFMRGDRLTREDENGKALYEFLHSISPEPGATLPMTVVGNVQDDIGRGDVSRGQQVYAHACQACHGAIHTGDGRVELAPVLPEVKAEFEEIFGPEVPPGLVFIEKTRHGQFFGVGGNMPYFSREALSDEDLAALLAYLEL